MEIKHEREEELGLKMARLKMLLQASDNLANEEFEDSKRWLLNYLDTIQDDTQAGLGLQKSYKELVTTYVKDIEQIENYFNYACKTTGIYGTKLCEGKPNTWREEQSEDALRRFIRNFHKLCWEVGNRADLLPKE